MTVLFAPIDATAGAGALEAGDGIATAAVGATGAF